MKIFVMAAINKVSHKTHSTQMRKIDEIDNLPLAQ